ncbi:MAG: MMPL family transporter [Acidimicrobiales bacterium]
MLSRLGLWCFVRPRRAIAVWVGLLVAIFGVSGVVGSAFDSNFDPPDSDTRDGFEVIDEHFGGIGSGLAGSIVFETDRGIDDPAVRTAMTEMFAMVDAIEGVSIASPYDGAGGSISPEGTIAMARVDLDPAFGDTEAGRVGDQIVDLVPTVDGLRVEIGGAALAGFEPPDSELVGLAFAVVVLIVAFGSVLAMGLPISVAVAGVGSGIGLVVLLSNITSAPDFSTTLAAMIGLGVGIDYALFIVTRYRQGLHEGRKPFAAMSRALDTAGRAVLFAGITVVVSLLGLLLMGLPFIAGLGIAASTTVLMTMLASLTLLPALLGLVGPRAELTRWRGLVAAFLVAVALLGMGLGIEQLLFGAPLAIVVLLAGLVIAPLRREVPRRPQRPVATTISYRWSRFVQRHPWPMAAVGAGLLVALALPVLGLRLGFSDEGNFDESTTTREAYDLLAEGFGPGFNGPLLVTVEVGRPDDTRLVPALLAAIEADPAVAAVSAPRPDDPAAPTAFLTRVVPTTAPQDEATEALVGRLRDEVIPAAVAGSSLGVNITGEVAGGVDFSDFLARRMPLFFGAVLLMSFLLLMVVFRSLLVPVKAVIMNLLSIGAAYGVVVAIFQWGWFGDLLGIEPAPVEPFLPMMMFAIVFGLSMDYEVFLLSRVKEEYDRTGDPVGSVADGLASTARVISAAAAIMVVVFGSFMFEDARVIRLFGLGLSSAVLLDATLVRMLLVPATMELLGERNWWIPARLDRLLPRLDVERGARPDADIDGEPPTAGPEAESVLV